MPYRPPPARRRAAPRRPSPAQLWGWPPPALLCPSFLPSARRLNHVLLLLPTAHPPSPPPHSPSVCACVCVCVFCRGRSDEQPRAPIPPPPPPLDSLPPSIHCCSSPQCRPTSHRGAGCSAPWPASQLAGALRAAAAAGSARRSRLQPPCGAAAHGLGHSQGWRVARAASRGRIAVRLLLCWRTGIVSQARPLPPSPLPPGGRGTDPRPLAGRTDRLVRRLRAVRGAGAA